MVERRLAMWREAPSDKKHSKKMSLFTLIVFAQLKAAGMPDLSLRQDLFESSRLADTLT